MNIVDTLQSFSNTASMAALVSPELSDIIKAIETRDIEKVDCLLKQTPQPFSHDKLIYSFVDNFTPELADVFKNNGFIFKYLTHISKRVEVPETVWAWVQHNNQQHDDSIFNWAQRMWASEPLSNSTQRRSACNFLALCPKRDLTFLQKVTDVFHTNNPSLWNDQDWNFLRSFTEQQWLQRFKNEAGEDGILTTAMQGENSQTQLNQIAKVFETLPNCAKAFNQHYNTNATDYVDIVDLFSSPAGIKQSAAYKSLSIEQQKQFYDTLQETYGGNCGSDIYSLQYQKLLGMMPEDFFLRRFGNFESSEVANFITNVHPSFHNIFQLTHTLSPLHVFVQDCSVLLQLDPSLGAQLAECFHDGSILQKWFDDLEPSSFQAILNRFPEISHWKDNKGNTLAHWYTVHCALDEEIINVFIAHPHLLEANTSGFTVRDIVQKDVYNGAVNQSVLNLLEQKILNIHLSTVTTEKKGTKRKM